MNYLPVNWTDGVKLNQGHFFQNYYNTIETIKNYNITSQNRYNYGILGKINGNTEAINIELLNDSGQELVLKLVSCNAITENGYRIIYYEDLYGDAYSPLRVINIFNYDTNVNQSFYVVITIDPFNPIKVGTPSPEVIPLHHPHVLPNIKIDIISDNQINTSYLKEFFLVVGKVKLTNGHFCLDKNYIPPVSKVDYSSKLKNFKDNSLQILLRVKNYSVQIFKKNKGGLGSNKLVENTFVLCEDINNFYCQNIFYFQSIVGEHPPIYFIERMIMLANKLSISLNTMDEKERELLLQYYYEWTDIKPSDFLNIIGSILSIQYNHMEIYKMTIKLNEFLDVIDKLFDKMSGLEYIGQRKDNIVISEDSEISQSNKKTKPAWSILD